MRELYMRLESECAALTQQEFAIFRRQAIRKATAPQVMKPLMDFIEARIFGGGVQ